MSKSESTESDAQSKDMLPSRPGQLLELEQLYRETEYRVDLPDTSLVLRIGQVARHLDRILPIGSPNTWAYVTAENPGSNPLSAIENQIRRQQLEEWVRNQGWEFYSGEGVGRDGYRERSLLVIGISKTEALNLARKFGQLAIVFGEPGREAELLWA